MVALAIGLAPSVGCSDDTQDTSETNGKRSSVDPPAPPSSDTGVGTTSDASATVSRGSPLCGVQEGGCVPDDDGANDGESSSGASVPNGSSGERCEETQACRVRALDDGSRRAECELSDADHLGTEGSECQEGSGCAAGFDCVDSERGGVCRRYCCDGSCDGQVSNNGGPTFCDIQKVVHERTYLVPVCMPLKKCKLLIDGECAKTETCGIVNETGDSGCVPVGNAKAGERCDEEHCAAGLTCLGYPGDRTCFQLCRTDGNDCPSGETCTTGAVFQNTAFGLCKAPIARAR